MGRRPLSSQRFDRGYAHIRELHFSPLDEQLDIALSGLVCKGQGEDPAVIELYLEMFIPRKTPQVVFPARLQ